MTAKELQYASARIKQVFESQNMTHINPELEMIDGVLWLVDESADRQLFSVHNPTSIAIDLAMVEWCATLPDGNYDGIAPF